MLQENVPYMILQTQDEQISDNGIVLGKRIIPLILTKIETLLSNYNYYNIKFRIYLLFV